MLTFKINYFRSKTIMYKKTLILIYEMKDVKLKLKAFKAIF